MEPRTTSPRPAAACPACGRRRRSDVQCAGASGGPQGCPHSVRRCAALTRARTLPEERATTGASGRPWRDRNRAKVLLPCVWLSAGCCPPAVVRRSGQCPWRSCAGVWGRRHGPRGTGPSCRGRQGDGTACASLVWRTSANPKVCRRATTSRGFRVGRVPNHATRMVCTATNSDSNFGSPSSRSMLITSCRLACNSSIVSP